MTPDPAASLGRIVLALVRLSLRRTILMLLLLALGTAGAGWLAATRFALDSDVTKLFPQDLPWRLAERQIEVAFPQRQDLIVIVLDAGEAREAEARAAALAQALRAHPGLFRSIRRPDEGRFWATHGLLYLDLPEVQAITEQIIAAQGLLGPFAADPSRPRAAPPGAAPPHPGAAGARLPAAHRRRGRDRGDPRRGRAARDPHPPHRPRAHGR